MPSPHLIQQSFIRTLPVALKCVCVSIMCFLCKITYAHISSIVDTKASYKTTCNLSLSGALHQIWLICKISTGFVCWEIISDERKCACDKTMLYTLVFSLSTSCSFHMV